MDLATLVGLVGTLIALAMAIVLGGSVTGFVDRRRSLVIGGTLLVTLMKFRFPQFLNATKVAFKAFICPHVDTQPRAANDAAANRALNRRVDTTFANGRDRPGAWSAAAPATQPL